jgi:hypothetical protein
MKVTHPTSDRHSVARWAILLPALWLVFSGAYLLIPDLNPFVRTAESGLSWWHALPEGWWHELPEGLLLITMMLPALAIISFFVGCGALIGGNYSVAGLCGAIAVSAILPGVLLALAFGLWLGYTALLSAGAGLLWWLRRKSAARPDP